MLQSPHQETSESQQQAAKCRNRECSRLAVMTFFFHFPFSHFFSSSFSGLQGTPSFTLLQQKMPSARTKHSSRTSSPSSFEFCCQETNSFWIASLPKASFPWNHVSTVESDADSTKRTRLRKTLSNFISRSSNCCCQRKKSSLLFSFSKRGHGRSIFFRWTRFSLHFSWLYLSTTCEKSETCWRTVSQRTIWRYSRFSITTDLPCVS